jgi:NRPS condensation-like uncharacterized protein
MGNFCINKSLIPERLPAADGDLVMSIGIDAEIALFTGNLELSFGHRLDAERLARALDLTFDSQPILGCKFVIEGRQMYWERLSKEARHSLYLFENESEFEQFRTLQIDSRTGPQIKVALYQSAAGDRLILKQSHQVADGGGLMDVVRELSTAYNRLNHDPAYQPEPNIYGSRSGKQLFRQISWTAFPVILVNFIKFLWSNNHPKATHTLPLPECQQNTPWTYQIRSIAPDRAARILEYGKKHLATLNDVMVTAYLRALATVSSWDGQSALRLQMTVDLRKWYLPEKRTEGICNLSAFEHVNLGTHLGDDFSDTLAKVSAIIRSRKKSYIGLKEVCLAPLASLIPYGRSVKLIAKNRRKQVLQKSFQDVLTNVGSISPECVTFDQPPIAARVLPHVLFPPPLSICLSGYAGSFTLATGAFQGSSPLVEQLLDQIVKELPD